MPRPRKKPEEKRERLSVTVSNGLTARLRSLHAETGLDPSTLVDKALLRVLPLFEDDHGEILGKGRLRTAEED